jgi:hypothetical protein
VKIEPLEIMSPSRSRAVITALWDEQDRGATIRFTGLAPFAELNREQLTALVRWGAAALAATSPDRMTPEAVAAERARLAAREEAEPDGA